MHKVQGIIRPREPSAKNRNPKPEISFKCIECGFEHTQLAGFFWSWVGYADIKIRNNDQYKIQGLVNSLAKAINSGEKALIKLLDKESMAQKVMASRCHCDNEDMTIALDSISKENSQSVKSTREIFDILKVKGKVKIQAKKGELIEGTPTCLDSNFIYLDKVLVNDSINKTFLPWFFVATSEISYIFPAEKELPYHAANMKVQDSSVEEGLVSGENILKTMSTMRRGNATWKDIAEHFNDRLIPTLSGKTKWTNSNTRLAYLSLKKQNSK